MAKYCPNCGTQVTDNAANCPTCGVAFIQQTQQPGVAQPIAPAQPGAKSKICAGLLGVFLGYLGIHNFYLGYTGKGIAQLLICIIGAFVLCGLGPIITWVWGLIEGIMILCGSITTDANGVPLTQ